MKKSVLLILFSFSFLLGYSQLDPQYSHMFNQFALNPAYAGSKDALCVTMLLRDQWVGVDGAPKTSTLAIHGPLRKKKIALGFSMISDELGPKKSVGLLGSFAYKIKIYNGQLAMGLRYGIYNYSFNWGMINYQDKNDKYNLGVQTQQIIPSADAGLYYNTKDYYIGFSSTHILSSRLNFINNQNNDNIQLTPHFFATAGAGFRISENLILNPSFVVQVPGFEDRTICRPFFCIRKYPYLHNHQAY